MWGSGRIMCDHVDGEDDEGGEEDDDNDDQ